MAGCKKMPELTRDLRIVVQQITYLLAPPNVEPACKRRPSLLHELPGDIERA